LGSSKSDTNSLRYDHPKSRKKVLFQCVFKNIRCLRALFSIKLIHTLYLFLFHWIQNRFSVLLSIGFIKIWYKLVEIRSPEVNKNNVATNLVRKWTWILFHAHRWSTRRTSRPCTKQNAVIGSRVRMWRLFRDPYWSAWFSNNKQGKIRGKCLMIFIFVLFYFYFYSTAPNIYPKKDRANQNPKLLMLYANQ
jgi:hypothetical protein